MLGDASRILAAVVSQKNLRRAFRYAIQDRPRLGFYFDPFELEVADEDALIH